MPWKLETYIAFSDAEKAKAFERYLKMGGGWRFAKRRLI
jgi:putative endonuclease